LSNLSHNYENIGHFKFGQMWKPNCGSFKNDMVRGNCTK